MTAKSLPFEEGRTDRSSATGSIDNSPTSADFLDMYARACVMGSYISHRSACAQTWSLFNDDRCTLPENWTRML
jgi:hypothetical protein